MKSCGNCEHKFYCDIDEDNICENWESEREPDFDLQRKSKEGAEK